MVNSCCYGGPLCMMSVRDISFFIMSPVMLFIWLTICNKKGTARDLCTIPLSSIIYYTTMKKISTTTYYHPILWHRIRCIFRHRHSPYMLPDLPRKPALLLRHGVSNRPVPISKYNFHHKHLHDLINL